MTSKKMNAATREARAELEAKVEAVGLEVIAAEASVREAEELTRRRKEAADDARADHRAAQQALAAFDLEQRKLGPLKKWERDLLERIEKADGFTLFRPMMTRREQRPREDFPLAHELARLGFVTIHTKGWARDSTVRLTPAGKAKLREKA